jgi:hypothetical protein
MPLLAGVEWGTVPDWFAVIGTTAAFMAGRVDDHQDPPGGEQAANPLQRDGTSRHATTSNAKVRDAIKALPLVGDVPWRGVKSCCAGQRRESMPA